MSAFLRTKDGSISTVGAILAHERTSSDAVHIDVRGAIAWARENGVALGTPKQALVNINRRRAELALPPFKMA